MSGQGEWDGRLGRLTELLDEDTAKDRERKRMLSLAFEVLEALPTACIVTDDVGKVVIFNDRAEHFFGYHRSEVLGRGVEMLIPVDKRHAHAAHREDYAKAELTIFARLMGGGTPLFGLTKKGQPVQLSIMLNRRILPTGTFNIALATRIPSDTESGSG